MLKLGWLPLAWLRTGMLALTLYFFFPLLSLSLRKAAHKIRLWELHVYYLIIIFWEIVTVAILFYLLKLNNLPLDTIGLRGRLSFGAIVYVIIGSIVGGILYPAVRSLVKVFGWDMFWHRREDKDWFPRTSGYLRTRRGIISMFSIVVICIPILEEIIFRGYVLTVLLQNLDSIFVAFILTSLIFASIHCLAGPGFMLFIFLGTFIMSFLYWKFGNIYPCILLHSLNTLIGEIIIPIMEKKGKIEE
jgi:membrane protease YdiL (CAAX protease family)